MDNYLSIVSCCLFVVADVFAIASLVMPKWIISEVGRWNEKRLALKGKVSQHILSSLLAVYIPIKQSFFNLRLCMALFAGCHSYILPNLPPSHLVIRTSTSFENFTDKKRECIFELIYRPCL